MNTEIPIHFDRDGAFSAVLAIVAGFRDGSLSNESAADLLDSLIDTGPWEDIDDPVFIGLVSGIDALVPDTVHLWSLLDRDPTKMRDRAAKVESENPEKAARIRARADKVGVRQS